MSENSIPQTGPVKITIQKGEGLTYALKRLAQEQKMKLSDDKITLNEWNATMDKLAEIQQTRKAGGGASIFSGGTDKTRAGWKNSFVVHPNQQIEFTKEEIASLYEAMGATFTAESTTVTELQNPVGSKKGAEQQQAGANKNGAAAEPAASSKKQAADKAAGSAQQKNDGNANNTEKTAAGGKVTQEQRKDDENKQYLADIKDGKELKRTYYAENGKTVNWTADYEYHANGNKSKATWTRGDGMLGTVSDYNQDGKKIRHTSCAWNGKMLEIEGTIDFEYHSNGNQSKEIWTNGDGKLNSVYDYNQNGKKLKETYYAEDAKTVTSTTDYEYHGNGNKSKIIYRRGDGSLNSVYDYNQAGNDLKNTSYAEDGQTVNKIIENDKLTLIRIKSENGNGGARNDVYKFDENGVCISSSLADALYDQISGASINSKTIALLKYINKDNVVKVIDSYYIKAGKTIELDLNDEWNFKKEDIEKYIMAKLAERRKELGLPDDAVFVSIQKADYAKTSK